MVTIWTNNLTLNNSAFFTHSVFMCFVWIWEQRAVISLYNINWLVFVTETECVYCAVRLNDLCQCHTAQCRNSVSTVAAQKLRWTETADRNWPTVWSDRALQECISVDFKIKKFLVVVPWRASPSWRNDWASAVSWLPLWVHVQGTWQLWDPVTIS